jgi:peptide/nickel transport system permease protein
MKTRIFAWSRLLGNFVVLLLGITTLMFFALRAAGDPTIVMAGENAGPEMIEALRQQYGFDQPLLLQYLYYLGNVLRLDFGASLASGQAALPLVLNQLPATLLLAFLGMTVTIAVAVPVGAWLGCRPDRTSARLVSVVVVVAQGMPGFVTALILIQVFVVYLMWFPSLGHADVRTWILPSLSLASFLAPKLIRVIAANVSEAMRQEYIRTARSIGSSSTVILWREAFPNAILGTVALISAQFAFLFSGAVIIEVLFLWPGIGLLLLESAQTLDFPVLQAIAFVVAVLVFFVNSLSNVVFRRLDPRIGEAVS